MTRAAVLRDPAIAAGPGQFGAIQAVAPSLGVELRPFNVRDADEIERSIAAFAQGSNGGLIVTGSPAAAARRDLIVALAARHRLPAVYNARLYGEIGGLVCYGADFLDEFRGSKQAGAERFSAAFAPKSRWGLFLRNQVIRACAIPRLARLAFGRDIIDTLQLPDYGWLAPAPISD